jgi:hypothetical protein
MPTATKKPAKERIGCSIPAPIARAVRADANEKGVTPDEWMADILKAAHRPGGVHVEIRPVAEAPPEGVVELPLVEQENEEP